MTKNEARILAKNTRNIINENDFNLYSYIITNKIENNSKYKEARVIGIYYPFGSEVDIKSLKHDYAIFAYPKIINGKMEFLQVNDSTKWTKSSFGVLEPVEGINVSNQIDLLIVSSLARNNLNYRLGYGKGYYDKFIKQYNSIYTIGVLFNNYTLDFKQDIWDIALDEYISN